jgi:hypothetical protein
MKVKDLIEQLKDCDQEQYVFVYINGDRYNVGMVDELDDCVDINARTEQNEY